MCGSVPPSTSGLIDLHCGPSFLLCEVNICMEVCDRSYTCASVTFLYFLMDFYSHAHRRRAAAAKDTPELVQGLVEQRAAAAVAVAEAAAQVST